MFLFLDHYKGLARYIDLLRRGGALHKAESFIELVISILYCSLLIYYYYYYYLGGTSDYSPRL